MTKEFPAIIQPVYVKVPIVPYWRASVAVGYVESELLLQSLWSRALILISTFDILIGEGLHIMLNLSLGCREWQSKRNPWEDGIPEELMGSFFSLSCAIPLCPKTYQGFRMAAFKHIGEYCLQETLQEMIWPFDCCQHEHHSLFTALSTRRLVCAVMSTCDTVSKDFMNSILLEPAFIWGPHRWHTHFTFKCYICAD